MSTIPQPPPSASSRLSSGIRHLASGLWPPASAGWRPASALWLLPLAWLWFVLINDLRVEWTVNPQYSYGWAVPFLCLFLLARKWKSGVRSQESEVNGSHQVSGLSISTFYFLLSTFAFCYLATRLIQEANPGWRLVSWALALEVIGITLIFLHLRERAESGKQKAAGRFRFPVSTFVFPLLFFLVAVPWPTVLEGPLIQALTRLDVSATCELASWLGIPALPHGNVIEVATGQVGIDEACSGIRSFQATLMISLFLGEFYALAAGRRALCILTGFALALLLNLLRQVVLVWVAARKGVPAIAEWHDPTGVIILLGCFFALWGIGRGLAGKNRKQNAESRMQKAEAAQPPEYSAFRVPLSTIRFSAFALSAWLLLVEAGVEGWYRFHEAKLPAAMTWQVDWPTNNPTYKELAFAPDTVRMLRFSDARNATWQEAGLGRQVIFIHWKPGAVAQRLAQSHTPGVCLLAAGHHLGWQSELQFVTVHGLRMPFCFYQLTDTPQPVFVAYCLWNDRSSAQGFEASGLDYRNRLAPVMAGIRNPGQRSLEIALTGVSDPAAAQTAVQKLLENIIAPGR